MLRSSQCQYFFWSLDPLVIMSLVTDAFTEITYWLRSRMPIRLQDLRDCCSSKLASDRRDLYFALFGLVNSWGRTGALIPDYTKSFEDALVHAAMTMLSDSWSLLVGSRSMHESLNLPSWLPGWAILTFLPDDTFHRALSPHPFHAIGDTAMEAELKGRSNLCLKIVRIGSVRDTIPGLFSIPSSKEGALSTFMDKMEMRNLARPHNMGSISDSFGRTVAHDLIQTKRAKRRVVEEDYGEFSAAFTSLNSGGGFFPPVDIYPPFAKMIAGCLCKTLFIMEDGMPGSGYLNTLPGDEVNIFLGCSLPFTVRRKSMVSSSTDEKECISTFEVIGNCYVHGIMDGEALHGGWEDRVDTIELI